MRWNRNRDRTTMTMPRRAPGGVRARSALAPIAALALAASLLGGCGSDADDDPDATTAAEQTDDAGSDDGSGTGADDGTIDDDTADDDTDDSDDMDSPGASEDSDDQDGPDDSDDPADDDGTEDADDGTQTGGDENLFEGSWGFGHDSKKLTAEELGDLVEDEAEARGPAEMSLEVECEDGIDTVAGDSEAECVAFADEGVQHLWHISAGPADAGLEIEVTNE